MASEQGRKDPFPDTPYSHTCQCGKCGYKTFCPHGETMDECPGDCKKMAEMSVDYDALLKKEYEKVVNEHAASRDNAAWLQTENDRLNAHIKAQNIVIEKALAFQKAAKLFRTAMLTDALTGGIRLVDKDLVGETVDNQAEALENLFKALNEYKKTTP